MNKCFMNMGVAMFWYKLDPVLYTTGHASFTWYIPLNDPSIRFIRGKPEKSIRNCNR